MHSPIRSRFARAAALAGVLVLAGFIVSGAREDRRAGIGIDVEADPRAIDEGEVVEFVARLTLVDPESGLELSDHDGWNLDGLGPIFDAGVDLEWHFDDGAVESGRHVEAILHRFSDSREAPYRVRALSPLLGLEKSVRILVRNVAPEIRGITRSRPSIAGAPVTFEGSATDPGINDELTYTWDFGDGAGGVGQSVEHTYAADGVYTVTLTVTDGDGGEDTRQISVPIGEVGSLQVTGDVTLPGTEIGRVMLAATTQNPFARSTKDPCQIRLEMSPKDSEASFVLTANLVPGLGERVYPVGRAAEWDGSHRDDVANRGVFFADLGLPREIGIRDFNGLAIGGPFWSRGGNVSVDYFDGNFLEISFEVTLLENIAAAYGPRWARVQGTLAQKVDRSTGGVFSALAQAFGAGETEEGVASSGFYLCDRDDAETFEIEERTPEASTVNVSFLNPNVEVGFSKAVDPQSIAGNFGLDYLSQSGLASVRGSWEPTPGDDRSVRFVPQSRLLDGVKYCVRVNTGEEGVRGREGEMLEEDLSASPPACRLEGAPPTAREWMFSTQVELAGATVEPYQASVAGEGTPLVPNKPTVSRVYTHWKGHYGPRGAAPAAQVKKFPARVSVLVNGRPAYPSRTVTVRDPRLFGRADRRNARNSINFYNWRPPWQASPGGGSVDLQAVIEPVDASGAPVDRFEGLERRVGIWDRTEILSFDYFFLRLEGECPPDAEAGCDWSEEIDAHWRAQGRRLAFAGAEFTTQTFPVIETQARPMGDLEIDEPLISDICTQEHENGYREDYRCYRLAGLVPRSAAHYVGERLWEAGRNSYADVLVGFVPPGFAVGWAGVMVPWQSPEKRVVLVDLTTANAAVLAHEFGHFFELDHCPGHPERDPECTPGPIQGFRVSPSGRSGLNKHHLEGNQESASLTPVMHWQSSPVVDQFIAAPQYHELFFNIAAAPTRQAALGPSSDRQGSASLLAALLRPTAAFAAAGPTEASVVTVSGRIHGEEVVIDRVRASAGESAPEEEEEGAFALELLDASGSVLETAAFAARAPDPWHGAASEGSSFRVSVSMPAAAPLAAVRVVAPSGAQARRERSAHAPEVRAEVRGSEGSGARKLAWSAEDADGDPLRFDVFVRGGAAEPWRGIAIDTERTNLALDPALLPPGERVTARIVASDGFDTAATEIDLGPGAPLSVLSATPGDGATQVPTWTDLALWLTAPLAVRSADEPLAPGGFELVDEDGETILVEVAYRAGSTLVAVTPSEELRPGATYTARVVGLEDVFGSKLAKPVEWTFTTAPEAEADEGYRTEPEPLRSGE